MELFSKFINKIMEKLLPKRLSATLFTCALGFGSAQPALAQSVIWNYLKQYQFGVDYTNSFDAVRSTYETDRAGGLAKDCELVTDDASKQRCSVDMQAGASSGWGLVLQQAFHRQGLFYFHPDVGFGARYLHGTLDKTEEKKEASAGLPLKDMNFSLAALLVKPYIQFGITPAKTWPDILFSIGPALQLAVGKVTVNDKAENVAIGTASGSGVGALFNGFAEVEVVFWRFGDGALSVFSSHDFTGGDGTKFYPKAIDGMSDFKGDFSHRVGGGVFGFGAKLVLDWP